MWSSKLKDIRLDIVLLILRARQWVVACHREDLSEKIEQLYSSCRLCRDHFEEKMFANALRNRLYPHAVPTIFPPLEGTATSNYDHSYTPYAVRPVSMSLHSSVTDCIEPPKKLRILQNIILSPSGKIKNGGIQNVYLGYFFNMPYFKNILRYR